MASEAVTQELAVDGAVLRRLLDGEHVSTRDRVRAWLRAPGHEPAAEGLPLVGLPPEHGGRGDVGASVAAFETLAFGDLSLLVKFGVQFGLFGGAILQLGTERHHAAHLRAAAALELPGCFAMTETGHGSNVQALR